MLKIHIYDGLFFNLINYFSLKSSIKNSFAKNLLPSNKDRQDQFFPSRTELQKMGYSQLLKKNPPSGFCIDIRLLEE